MVSNRFEIIAQRRCHRMIDRLRHQGISDELVLEAMSEIPRHIFVDKVFEFRAYEDMTLPLGYGQTISNPVVVAKMIEILRNGRHLKRVLEVGTGCGYQAGVLSLVADEVHTIERIQGLVDKAYQHLSDLEIGNVSIHYADGNLGLAEFAPFDAIIVAAAAEHIPDALLEQLDINGRLIIPVGSQARTKNQKLYLVEKTIVGYKTEELDSVRFVPMLDGLI